MSSCQYALNTDISGIGVRVSYYLQTLFLGCLSARSGSLAEIAGALYTLMATNTAMAVTGLILGLQPRAEISFQDAIIIIYLLLMAWITVIFSLTSCNSLSGDTEILQLVSVVQSYVILAFIFVVLGQAASFGQSPECNQQAVAVIFRPFSALKAGRIVGWIIVILMTTGYTTMTARDYTTRVIREIRARKQRYAQEVPLGGAKDLLHQNSQMRSAPADATPILPRRSTNYGARPKPLVDWDLLFTLFCIFMFWTFFVLNIELVIRWNQPTHTDGDSGPKWQFGQILPMFLNLLPFINMVGAFKQFGIKPTKQVDRPMKVAVVWDVAVDAQ